MEPCSSTVLQFDVDEVGQLVPLLPHPCGPISATRWQTEDLDGNKVLFQVRCRRCRLSFPRLSETPFGFHLNNDNLLCACVSSHLSVCCRCKLRPHLPPPGPSPCSSAPSDPRNATVRPQCGAVVLYVYLYSTVCEQWAEPLLVVETLISATTWSLQLLWI